MRGSPFYIESGIPGHCQVTVGQNVYKMCPDSASSFKHTVQQSLDWPLRNTMETQYEDNILIILVVLAVFIWYPM